MDQLRCLHVRSYNINIYFMIIIPFVSFLGRALKASAPSQRCQVTKNGRRSHWDMTILLFCTQQYDVLNIQTYISLQNQTKQYLYFPFAVISYYNWVSKNRLPSYLGHESVYIVCTFWHWYGFWLTTHWDTEESVSDEIPIWSSVNCKNPNT